MKPSVALSTPAIAIALTLLPRAALAQRDPEEKKENVADRAWVAKKKRGLEVDRAVLPLVGGSTDYGIAIGAMGSIAWIDPDKPPYIHRIEGNAITSFGAPAGDAFQIPYQDYYLKGTHRHWPIEASRLTWRAGYTRASTLQYSGIGNASGYDRSWENIDPDKNPEAFKQAKHQYNFDRKSPGAAIEIRFDLPKSFFYEESISFTHNSIYTDPNSKLAQDRASTDPRIRQEVDGPLTHGVVLFTQAVGIDTRNAEIATTKGMLHRVSLRVSPGAGSYLAYRYAAVDASFRGYVPLFDERIVLAGRLVFDAIWGDAPFYELARYEAGWAIGGSSGVRGVPAQRYFGKVKVFGNTEARIHLFRFGLFKQKMRFGVATFFDAGRVFSDFTPKRDLDGSGIGLKYGAGGGLRLAAGKSFEARADVAYSPDANPVSVYVSAGQAF